MSNPYLEQSLGLLGRLNWEMTPDQIKSKTNEIIQKMQCSIDKVLSLSEDQRSFDNVVKYLELENSKLGADLASLYFPAYVSTDSEVRAASSESSKKLSEFQIEVVMNKELFEVYLSVEDREENLIDVDKLLLERSLRDFRRMGLELSEKKQTRLKEIEQELSKLAIEFQQTLNEVDDTIVFTTEELSGIPDHMLNSLKRIDDGNFEVGVTYPEADVVLGYCSNPKTRERYSKMFGNRAREENTPRLKRALELRDEKAKLMGYHSHAEFALAIKMAESPERVVSFLDDLEMKLHPLGLEELEELVSLKQEDFGGEQKILSSDFRYYSNILKDKKYSVDKQEIKQYFPTLFVVDKMLEFYQEIFSLKFYEIANPPTWHEDVRAFSIVDNQSSEFIGVFFLDLYPRKGKFSHAAAFPLIGGYMKEDGTYQNTVAAMVCNFPKDTEEQPSLLSHDEVETLYHEFGHIIHQTTTRAKYRKFSGSSVSRDFVEAPSQMLENWVWEPSILKGISKHYKTGDPLPDELMDKMVKAKTAIVGLRYLRQIFFATYDMTVHNRWSPDLDIETLWGELQEKISLIPSTEGTFPGASFGHIIGGYDAGYYGYLWSEVIAQDLYTRFEKEGATSKKAGLDYRKFILEPGNETPEEKLVENFLGRNYNNEAFLRSLGL